MTSHDVHRRIWQNTASNYLFLAVRTLVGLVTFRLLFQYLSPEEFGFWALLWSLFGYGILVDFGLGLTVQKEVARLSIGGHWRELSEIVSTMVFGYCGVGAVLAATAALGSHVWIGALNIDPLQVEEFRPVLVVFACGFGLGLPLGIFREILRGHQRIMLLNIVGSLAGLVRLVGMFIAVRQEWSLRDIVLFALACVLAPSVVCIGLSLHLLPRLRIRPRNFNRRWLASSTKFSAYAYVIMLGYMLQTKIDLFVIGTCLSVSAIQIYQPGAKCGELFSTFTNQLASALQPAAAHLHASGEHGAVRRMLVGGMRYSVMLAIPGYLMLASQLDAVLLHLTGLAELDDTTYWVGQILLLWSVNSLTTHNVYYEIAMMCGHERRLAFTSIIEAGLNAGMSVVLVLVFGDVLWVALGSLVPTLLVGWGVLWRWAARQAELGPMQLAWQVFGRTPWAALILVAWLLLVRVATSGVERLDPTGSAWALLLVLATSGLVALAATWRVGLEAEERQVVRGKLASLVRAR